MQRLKICVDVAAHQWHRVDALGVDLLEKREVLDQVQRKRFKGVQNVVEPREKLVGR